MPLCSLVAIDANLVLSNSWFRNGKIAFLHILRLKLEKVL